MEQLTQTTTTEVMAAGPRSKGAMSGTRPGARRHWPVLVGTAAVAGAVGAALGIWAVNGSPSDDKPGAATVLRQLEVQRLQAQVDADVATADTLLAPDFTQVTPDGAVLTKDDELELLESGNVDFKEIDVVGHIAVSDYGHAAVLTYRTTMSLTVQGMGDLHHDAWDTCLLYTSDAADE